MIQRESTGLSLTFDPAKLAGRIVHRAGAAAWRIDLAAARGVACGQPEPMWAEFPWAQNCRALERLRPLRPSDLRRTRELPEGVELDFHVGGADFRIALRLGPEPDELVFALQPLPTGQTDLIAAELPGPIAPEGGDPIQVLTGYRHQGRLYTGGAGALEPETPDVRELPLPEGRHRLRFVGVLGAAAKIGSARAGHVAIVDENADARFVIRQAGDNSLSCSVDWLPSIGTLAYARIVRYRFMDRPTVTALAKEFRRYARSTGLYMSLRDKIAQRPIVGRMVGATACFIGYEASDLDYLGTFRRLRETGHKAFYAFPLFHINFAGGEVFTGLESIDIRAQADALRAVGAIPGSWVWLGGVPNRPELLRLAARNADGTHPLNWRMHDVLFPQACMSQAEQFLASRDEDLLAADAHHFDTTASNGLMECYAPSHALDRRGDRACRIRLFHEAARRGRFVASEGVKDWAVPHYDMGSNKEVPHKAGNGAFRVVPVQHLVYHDALFMLWWEVDGYDTPYFHGGDLAGQSLTDLLYGDMPLIFPVGRQYRWTGGGIQSAYVEFEQSLAMPAVAAAALRAVDVARNFERVALEEMTDFTWLTGDGAVQQTQFGNGASVIANFGREPFEAPSRAVVAPMEALCL